MRALPDNPYQPPSDCTPLESSELRLWVWGVLKESWGAMAGRWLLCAGTSLLISILGLSALGFITGHKLGPETAYPMLLTALLFTLWLSIGQARICLELARKGSPRWETVLLGSRHFLRIVAAFFVLGIVFLTGVVFLIVPGILFLAMFLPSLYLILDRGLSVYEAFHESSRITEEHLFDLSLVFAVLVLLGLPIATPIIGVVYAYFYVPYAYTVVAVVYLRLTEQTDEADSDE